VWARTESGTSSYRAEATNAARSSICCATMRLLR
jgi:hypothetical protein